MSELRMEGENARIIIANLRNLLGIRYRQSPLWVLVSDVTGHGSGLSAQICRSAGLDPCELCLVRKKRKAKV